MRHRGLSTLFSLVAAILLGAPSAWAAAPAAPAFLRSFASSDASVTLLWDDNSPDEAYFGIAVTDNGSAPGYITLPSSSGTGGYGRTFPSLFSPGHTYTVAACSLTSTYEPSAYTNTITLNTGPFNPTHQPHGDDFWRRLHRPDLVRQRVCRIGLLRRIPGVAQRDVDEGWIVPGRQLRRRAGSFDLDGSLQKL